MVVFGIIPARSGSKGIKDKNIKKINNQTLIEIAYNVCKKSKIFTEITVSTDSKKYLNILKKRGIKITSLRSKKFSKDNSTDLELMNYEILKYEKKIKKKIDYLALIQPSSPLRTSKDLKECFRLIKKKKYDAVWTISKIDKKFNPIKILKTEKNDLRYYSKSGSTFVSRQKLSDVYIRNGVAYFFSRDAIIKFKEILPKKSTFLEIKRKVINIDYVEDLKNASKYLQKTK